jgi:aspartokinase-like uncharacterized kinase
VDAVIKVGGALLQLDGALDHVARAVTAVARARRLLVVPGGGVFADAVRAVDRDARAAGAPLGDDAAHWMAVLAIDQYAQMLAARIPGAELVDGVAEVQRALDVRHLPVLAPHRWLRAADPLPHSWDVTSDSIAAWVAGAMGAATLVLVKGVSGAVEALTDPYFARAKPHDVRAVVLAAGEVDGLADVLS